MQGLIGLSADQVKTSSEGAAFRLGTLGVLNQPAGDSEPNGDKIFMYVKAGEAITGLGYLCQVDTDFSVQMVDSTSSAPGVGQGKSVGAAQAAIAADGFGWIQVYGKGSLRTLASAAVGTALYSTATPGAVDDAATAGLEVINGLTLGTATGGAAATNADAYFAWPTIGATA